VRERSTTAVTTPFEESLFSNPEISGQVKIIPKLNMESYFR
jgi:hypothetical protein